MPHHQSFLFPLEIDASVSDTAELRGGATYDDVFQEEENDEWDQENGVDGQEQEGQEKQ